ncbi:MAG: ABC transporter ATP-binding protein/permease [Ruminococcus sp.]|nr:ABC transporter ATP-binding protein/permease [Ruminococcus sp.]
MIIKNSTVKWISDVVGKHKFKILLLCIIQAVLGGCGVLYAMLLRNGIDCAVEKDKPGFMAALISVILLILFQITLRAVLRRLDELTRSSVENKLKKQLFGVLLKKDYASVTRTHSEEWLNRLTSDTKVTADGTVDILPGIIRMAVQLVGALTMLVVIEYRFLYVLIPGGLIMLLFTYGFRKNLKKMHKAIQEADGKLRIFMQEHISNLIIVKSFSAEDKTAAAAQEKMSDHQDKRMKRNSFSNICNIGFAIAMNGMYLIGFAYCGYGIISAKVSYGTLTAVLQLITQVEGPFANITGYLPKFYAMTASAERLREAESYADDDSGHTADSEQVRNLYENELASIRLSGVSFSYIQEDGEKTVRNVDFTVRKGDYVAFTGHSGCGKSTVLKLLMCLYKCDSGDIRLNMTDSSSVPMTSEWHRLFAYVPQGNQLMSGSIREIVSFADEKTDDERIAEALKISCADEFVRELENGTDTVLGERGTGLSEGQMQRIAIARAIYTNSPVLLLDEATSSLDEKTERQVLDNIRSMTDKTVIIVTHRPAALEICNKILDFSEEGTVMKKNE